MTEIPHWAFFKNLIISTWATEKELELQRS